MTIPWREFDEQAEVGDDYGGEASRGQFDYYAGRIPKIDLSEIDVSRHAATLARRLDGLTKDKQDSVAELLFLALKTARTICDDLGAG